MAFLFAGDSVYSLITLCGIGEGVGLEGSLVWKEPVSHFANPFRRSDPPAISRARIPLISDLHRNPLLKCLSCTYTQYGQRSGPNIGNLLQDRYG